MRELRACERPRNPPVRPPASFSLGVRSEPGTLSRKLSLINRGLRRNGSSDRLSSSRRDGDVLRPDTTDRLAIRNRGAHTIRDRVRSVRPDTIAHRAIHNHGAHTIRGRVRPVR